MLVPFGSIESAVPLPSRSIRLSGRGVGGAKPSRDVPVVAPEPVPGAGLYGPAVPGDGSPGRTALLPVLLPLPELAPDALPDVLLLPDPLAPANAADETVIKATVRADLSFIGDDLLSNGSLMNHLRALPFHS